VPCYGRAEAAGARGQRGCVVCVWSLGRERVEDGQGSGREKAFGKNRQQGLPLSRQRALITLITLLLQ